MARIVITGGAGFIASHITDAYIAIGHEVLVIDNLSSGKKEFINSKAHFVHADIRSEQALSAITEFRPDFFNHHAAQMDVRLSVADPIFDAEVNIMGLLKILQILPRTPCKKIIFASSGGAAYGEQLYFPADEQHQTNPASPYGVSKRCSELYLNYYHQMHGVPYVALRYSNVYGPRQNPHGEAGVVAIFAQKCLKHQRCAIYGDGEQTRDFVYVGDVVKANLRALTVPFCGEVNIGTGVETSINAVFKEISTQASGEQGVDFFAKKPGEQKRSVLSYQKAQQVLDWAPSVTFSLGIKQTLHYFAQSK